MRKWRWLRQLGETQRKSSKSARRLNSKKVSVMWSRWWGLSKNESQGEYDREKWMHMSSDDQEAGMFVIHKCVAVRHAQTAAKMGRRLNEDGLSGSCSSHQVFCQTSLWAYSLGKETRLRHLHNTWSKEQTWFPWMDLIVVVIQVGALGRNRPGRYRGIRIRSSWTSVHCTKKCVKRFVVPNFTTFAMSSIYCSLWHIMTVV